MNFINEIIALFDKSERINNKDIKRLAEQHNITDLMIVKEAVETAIVLLARNVASEKTTVLERFRKIVDIYEKQPFLSQRTSVSIKLQQYSTPVPYAFLVGMLAKGNRTISNCTVLEPSAGNGALTVLFDKKNVVVNELDDTRLENLKKQGFKRVYNLDALTELDQIPEKANTVVINPPFGALPSNIKTTEYKNLTLDQVMAIKAIEKNDGCRAAIILGGHVEFDNYGRITGAKNKVFYSYLYRNYKVETIIYIDGDMYKKQGTRFPTRIIVINGKAKDGGRVAPLKSDADNVVKTYDELFLRVAKVLATELSNNLKKGLK